MARSSERRSLSVYYIALKKKLKKIKRRLKAVEVEGTEKVMYLYSD